MVSDIGDDSAEQVASYLYESLVTEVLAHEPIPRDTETEARRLPLSRNYDCFRIKESTASGGRETSFTLSVPC